MAEAPDQVHIWIARLRRLHADRLADTDSYHRAVAKERFLATLDGYAHVLLAVLDRVDAKEHTRDCRGYYRDGVTIGPCNCAKAILAEIAEGAGAQRAAVSAQPLSGAELAAERTHGGLCHDRLIATIDMLVTAATGLLTEHEAYINGLPSQPGAARDALRAAVAMVKQA